MRTMKWVEVEIEGPSGHDFIRVVAYSAAEACMKIRQLNPNVRLIDTRYLKDVSKHEQKRMGIV